MLQKPGISSGSYGSKASFLSGLGKIENGPLFMPTLLRAQILLTSKFRCVFFCDINSNVRLSIFCRIWFALKSRMPPKSVLAYRSSWSGGHTVTITKLKINPEAPPRKSHKSCLTQQASCLLKSSCRKWRWAAVLLETDKGNYCHWNLGWCKFFLYWFNFLTPTFSKFHNLNSIICLWVIF